VIEPNQLADVWYLKFGHNWVVRDGLDNDWKEIANTLMKHDYLRYELSCWGESTNGPNGKRQVSGVTEILKLKGD
jgi:hypothetical protein